MDEKRKSGMSRREFARRAAMASAAVTASAVAPLVPNQTVDAGSSPSAAASANGQASVLAAAHTPATELSAPAPAQQPPGMPKLSPESQAEVDSRIQAIFSQYGSRFSEEQKADIRRLCAVAQPPLDRLRAYALENGDGPALYLKPLVERERKPAAAQSASSQQPANTTSASPKTSAGSPTSSPLAKTAVSSAAPASSATSKAPAPGNTKTPPTSAAKKP